MNKFTKYTYLIAGAIALCGLLCVIVGALGGGFEKAKSIPLNNRFITYNTSHIEISEDAEVIGNGEVKEFFAGDIKNLDFALGACKVDVIPSDNNTVTISNTTKLDIQSELADNTLRIYCDEDTVMLTNSGQVTISIPANMTFDNVDFSFGAIEYKQSVAMTADTCTIELGAGDMEVESLNASYIEANVGAGNLTLKKTFAKNADFEIGMGNLDMDGNISNNMELDCGIGNASLILDCMDKDHNVSYDVSMGTFKYGSNQVDGISGGNYIDNGSDYEYTIACSMGNVDITFNERI